MPICDRAGFEPAHRLFDIYRHLRRHIAPGIQASAVACRAVARVWMMSALARSSSVATASLAACGEGSDKPDKVWQRYHHNHSQTTTGRCRGVIVTLREVSGRDATFASIIMADCRLDFHTAQKHFFFDAGCFRTDNPSVPMFENGWQPGRYDGEPVLLMALRVIREEY